MIPWITPTDIKREAKEKCIALGPDYIKAGGPTEGPFGADPKTWPGSPFYGMAQRKA